MSEGESTLLSLNFAPLFKSPHTYLNPACRSRKITLSSLDDSREWFRFHRLFADFLCVVLQQRSPADIPVLHQWAARWYLAQNQPDPTFRHAVAGDDAALTDQIIERYFAAKLLSGEVKRVERWLNSVPASWNEDSATLRLAQAGVLLVTGQFDACARTLDTAEHLAHTSSETKQRLQQARVTAMRCISPAFRMIWHAPRLWLNRRWPHWNTKSSRDSWIFRKMAAW